MHSLRGQPFTSLFSRLSSSPQSFSLYSPLAESSQRFCFGSLSSFSSLSSHTSSSLLPPRGACVNRTNSFLSSTSFSLRDGEKTVPFPFSVFSFSFSFISFCFQVLFSNQQQERFLVAQKYFSNQNGNSQVFVFIFVFVFVFVCNNVFLDSLFSFSFLPPSYSFPFP